MLSSPKFGVSPLAFPPLPSPPPSWWILWSLKETHSPWAVPPGFRTRGTLPSAPSTPPSMRQPYSEAGPRPLPRPPHFPCAPCLLTVTPPPPGTGPSPSPALRVLLSRELLPSCPADPVMSHSHGCRCDSHGQNLLPCPALTSLHFSSSYVPPFILHFIGFKTLCFNGFVN